MAYQSLARRLKFLTRSLRRHGAGHVAEVFRQAAVRRAYARSPIGEPDAAELRAVLGYSGPPEAFVEWFAHRERGGHPMLLWRRKDFFKSLVSTTSTYDSILDEAEALTEGRFTALGIATLEPGGAYDWHRDYSSGTTWPRVPFDRIEYSGGDGSDVKYVWELSRMYWIGWLGNAWLVSGNGAWARDFQRMVDSWRSANPVNLGVNWAMPMEVGIRAFWLASGFDLFHDAPQLDDAWWSDYMRLLWAHGTYLERNLEYFSNLTNHYVANCFGLVVCGWFFGGAGASAAWLAEGRRRLIDELDHQVCGDGTHYERSLPYHRLVLEMYLVASVLLERAGAPLPTEALGRIERMAELLIAVIGPDGTIPQIGDADDGVLLRLQAARDVYDAGDTAALAAVLFGRRDFAAKARFGGGTLLMMGGEGFERLQTLKRTDSAAAAAASRIFEEGGFAVMERDGLQVVADFGPIGFHGNNDTLSFALAGPHGWMVVDPGTYCYTRNAALRNELRRAAAHNAPVVDDRDTAAFDGLWRVEDRTRPELISWRSEPDGPVLLEAAHRAWDGVDGLRRVVRRWELSDVLRIEDRIEGTGRHEVSARFTIPADVSVDRVTDACVRLVDGAGNVLTIEASLPLAIEEGWYSPGYGVASGCTCVVARSVANLPAEFVYLCRLSPSNHP